ncbi:hypothetical protein [Burkholderia pyrrocinia]|uniref:hypothetical protein n=1 Tax=Burkholderia pyrrocinia TaxID=60550 RepID=UPI00158E6F1B|nr:hypothetical protein [Burkholderia pyrrocinia]
MTNLQRNDLAPDEPLHVAAATLLLLASKTAYASEVPPWGREHALELLDALLSLSSKHGFAQEDLLRVKLLTRTRTRRAQLLAEIAFEEVPISALLDIVRQSSFYFGE